MTAGGFVDAQAGSVRNLQNLYSVVATIALTIAVSKLISFTVDEPRIAWEVLPNLLAYLFTIVPFYHGALRYLDRYYVESPANGGYGARLLWDFAILFLEACVLLAAAALIADPVAFVASLIVLWSLDIVWGTAGILIRSTEKAGNGRRSTPSRPCFSFPCLSLAATGRVDEIASGIVLLIISVAPSVANYRWNWTFYFPS